MVQLKRMFCTTHPVAEGVRLVCYRRDGAQFWHSALSFAGPCSLRAQFFGELVGVHGVLVRLFAEFVSG